MIEADADLAGLHVDRPQVGAEVQRQPLAPLFDKGPHVLDRLAHQGGSVRGAAWRGRSKRPAWSICSTVRPADAVAIPPGEFAGTSLPRAVRSAREESQIGQRSKMVSGVASSWLATRMNASFTH